MSRHIARHVLENFEIASWVMDLIGEVMIQLESRSYIPTIHLKLKVFKTLIPHLLHV